jgi:hypothetical protein
VPNRPLLTGRRKLTPLYLHRLHNSARRRMRRGSLSASRQWLRRDRG